MPLVAPAGTQVTRAKGSRLSIVWQLPDVELLTAYYFRIYAKEHDANGKPLHNFGFLISTKDNEDATNERRLITPPLKPLTTYTIQGAATLAVRLLRRQSVA